MTLIQRLEQCTEGSRELADEVLLACGWKVTRIPLTGGCFETHWYDPSGTVYVQNLNPLASFDAAMQLVPEGYTYLIDARHPVGRIMIDLFPEEGLPVEGKHMNVAIAICIAALRARGVTQ